MALCPHDSLNFFYIRDGAVAQVLGKLQSGAPPFIAPDKWGTPHQRTIWVRDDIKGHDLPLHVGQPIAVSIGASIVIADATHDDLNVRSLDRTTTFHSPAGAAQAMGLG